MSGVLRALGVLSALELLSLLVLLTNLATTHHAALTSALGPTHGALYLAVACTALLARDLSPRTRVGALLPVLSGPLTMVNVRREARG